MAMLVYQRVSKTDGVYSVFFPGMPSNQFGRKPPPSKPPTPKKRDQLIDFHCAEPSTSNLGGVWNFGGFYRSTPKNHGCGKANNKASQTWLNRIHHSHPTNDLPMTFFSFWGHAIYGWFMALHYHFANIKKVASIG